MVLALAAAGRADEEEGKPVVADWNTILRVAHANSPTSRTTVVDVTDAPAELSAPRAVRIETLKGAAMWWDVQKILPNVRPIRKGDVLHLTVWLRCTDVKDETGQGSVRLYFQKNSTPYEKSVMRQVRVGPTWTLVPLAFRAHRDFAPGVGALGLAFGDMPQTVEVAEGALVNYGPDKSIDDLPTLHIDYPGRADDAPWRAEAQKRIDRLRKADVVIRVVDRQGQPVDGADVHVRQTRHAFKFGSTVVPAVLTADTADAEKYRAVVEKWFNHVSIENALKWKRWGGPPGDPRNVKIALDGLRWLKARDIPVHGHVLVWPNWQHVPNAVARLRNDTEKLAATIDEHIRELMGATAGLTYEWDVVNEAFSNHQITDVLGGQKRLVEWFKTAGAARGPGDERRLYYNDYGILAAGGMTDSPHQEFYCALVRTLLEAGAPLEGLGVQGHFGSNPTPPETLLKILDRLAEFKLPIQITEYDVDSEDYRYQADYMRDVLTVAFSHPAVNGFVMWGFWEGRHWRPVAALYDRQWNLRPHGKVFEDLVFKTWWTDVQAKADANGEVRTRAFQGTYDVSAGPAGSPDRTSTSGLQLGKDGATWTLTVE